MDVKSDKKRVTSSAYWTSFHPFKSSLIPLISILDRIAAAKVSIAITNRYDDRELQRIP